MKKYLLLLVFCLPAVVASNTELGRRTYTIACQTCHSPKVAEGLGAPAAFDKAAWRLRFISANAAVRNNDKFKTAYDYLVYQVKIGKGLMQHHGLCLESTAKDKSCTDKAYIAAIKYMAKK